MALNIGYGETEEAQIERRLAAHGFKLEGTGGNCTAYVRRAVDGFEEYLTVADDPTHPVHLTDLVSVGNYDGSKGDGDDMTTGYTLADVLAVLEDETLNEYALLSLRLYNSARRRGGIAMISDDDPSTWPEV